MRRTADVSPFIATRDYDAMIGMFNRTGHFNPDALKVVSRSFVEMGMLPSEPDINSADHGEVFAEVTSRMG